MYDGRFKKYLTYPVELQTRLAAFFMELHFKKTLLFFSTKLVLL